MDVGSGVGRGVEAWVGANRESGAAPTACTAGVGVNLAVSGWHGSVVRVRRAPVRR